MNGNTSDWLLAAQTRQKVTVSTLRTTQTHKMMTSMSKFPQNLTVTGIVPEHLVLPQTYSKCDSLFALITHTGQAGLDIACCASR